MRVCINGLSAGGGGGYTVATEMARWLCVVRPSWSVTLMLRATHLLHEEARHIDFPENLVLQFIDADLKSRRSRRKFEMCELPTLLAESRTDCLINLNGMIMGCPGVPTVCHFQDPWAYRPEAWLGIKDHILACVKRWQHRKAIAKADLCTWTSHYLEDLTISSNRVTPQRSQVIYNGIPDHWVDRSNPVPRQDRPMTIATVSNVAHYKRQWLVVEAMAKLASQGRLDFNYHIVGQLTDAYRNDLQARIERNGLADNVVIEGRVSSERLLQVLATARVMPMMSVCESFGIPCIEAMSLGTPVVIADCCALPEVCGDAAIRIKVDDIDGLSEVLFHLMSDSDQWQRLSKAGLNRVREFRWRTSMEKLAPEIANLVADENKLISDGLSSKIAMSVHSMNTRHSK